MIENHDQTAFVSDPDTVESSTDQAPHEPAQRVPRFARIGLIVVVVVLVGLVVAILRLQPGAEKTNVLQDTPTPTIAPKELTKIGEKIKQDLEEARAVDPDQLLLSFPPVDFKSRLTDPTTR